MRSLKFWLFIPFTAFALGLAVGCSDSDKKNPPAAPPTPVAPQCTVDCGTTSARIWEGVFTVPNDDKTQKRYREFIADLQYDTGWGAKCSLDVGAFFDNSCKNYDGNGGIRIELDSTTLPTLGTVKFRARNDKHYDPRQDIYVSIKDEFFPTNANTGFGMSRIGFPFSPSYNARFWIFAEPYQTDKIKVNVYYDRQYDTQDSPILYLQRSIGWAILSKAAK